MSINLEQIIQGKNLDVNEVSDLLFPNNKHPRLALNRVFSGESTLDAEQISRFANRYHVKVADMFSGVWGEAEANGRFLILKNGDYVAKLDKTTWTTHLFDKGSLFHEHVLHPDGITLKAYLETLETLILTHKTQKSND